MFSTVIAYSKLSSIDETICKISENDEHRWLNRAIENFETDLLTAVMTVRWSERLPRQFAPTLEPPADLRAA